MKRILILGGSYFIGRVFSIMADNAKQFDLSLINRGRFPLRRPSIKEYVFDRHDPDIARALENEAPYDALVDFCAYEPGDSRDILTLLKGKIGQYIEVSSCAIFAPSAEPRTEESSLSSAAPKNEVEEYAYKKMLLEKEIWGSGAALGVPCTVLRPCFVYGPFNYAPRESFYFKLILSGAAVPHPVDAVSEFSFVYVRDIARAIMACAGNPETYNRAFNLAGPERASYPLLLETLRTLVTDGFPVETVSLAEVNERNIPLPFPLDQNELFDGEKARRELGIEYTCFAEGMKESFSVYKASTVSNS